MSMPMRSDPLVSQIPHTTQTTVRQVNRGALRKPTVGVTTNPNPNGEEDKHGTMNDKPLFPSLILLDTWNTLFSSSSLGEACSRKLLHQSLETVVSK